MILSTAGLSELDLCLLRNGDGEGKTKTVETAFQGKRPEIITLGMLWIDKCHVSR